MNALARTSETRPTAAASPPRSKSIGVGLAAAEAKYLVGTYQGLWSPEVFREVVELTNPMGDAPLRQRWRDAARVLAIAPPIHRLDGYLAAVEQALEGPPDERATRYMIGLLVAGFPNGRPPDLDGYCETLKHDALRKGYTPSVVVQACQSIRETQRFLPSTAEFLQACSAAHAELESARRLVTIVRDRLAKATVIATEPEPHDATEAVN